jgi:hypothetical protein
MSRGAVEDHYGVSGFQIGDRVADMTVVGSNAADRTLRADRLDLRLGP